MMGDDKDKPDFASSEEGEEFGGGETESRPEFQEHPTGKPQG